MTHSAPFFSVIIPSYNRQKEVANAIQSVLKQNFTDFEILLIDDGSTDNTIAFLVDTFDDVRLRVSTITHAGRSAARNKGLEIARGKWICFLDSDDEYMSGVLQAHFDKVTTFPALAAFACERMLGDQPTRYKKKRHQLNNIELWFGDFIEDNLLTVNQICFKHQEFNGLFPLGIDFAEDWYFFRALSFSHNILKHDYLGVQMSNHENRSMNTVRAEKLARDNFISAQLTCEELPLSPSVRQQLITFTGLLCANIALSGGGSKSEAWYYFKKGLSLRALGYKNFYRGLVKFVVR